jgi:hypothetical protein
MGQLTDITKSSLKSIAVRKTIAGESGIRTIGKRSNPLIPSWLSSFAGGLLGAVFNFGGWAIGLIFSGVSFTASAIWGAFTNAVGYLANFNWNATDESLDAQLAGLNAQIGSLLGGTIGNLAGWIACGVLPGATIFMFNELLGAKILLEVGREALEELASNVGALVQASWDAMLKKTLITSFKGIRRWIKNYFHDPLSPQSQWLLSTFGGETWANILRWGEHNSRPWSYNIAKENWIESITDPFWQNFTEELYDEYFDACVEAGYVVAGEIDQYIAEKQLEKAVPTLGQSRAIELTPNREVPEEKIVLAGPQEALKPAIVQAMAQNVIMENRSVGMFVGESITQTIRTNPAPIFLRLLVNEVQSSPYMLNGKQSQHKQITVPNVKRSKVDWHDIKTALGGANGYNYGRFRGRAHLDGGHTIEVYAGSEAEVKDRLVALAALSEESILTINVNEEIKYGSRLTYGSLYKETRKVYPIAITIVNQQKILNEANGRATLTGIYKRKRALIPLNVDTKPADFEEIVNELFSTPGPG